MIELKTIGDEVLKKIAQEVPRHEIQQKDTLINEMISIMRENVGVGIAAPQIGVSERIVVIEIEENKRYPNVEKMPLTVMINPKIKILDSEIEDGYEGCLSVPGIRGIVPRYKKIEVEYLNMNGQEERKVLENFPAKVVQHEVDHLEGMVFLERVIDKKSFITNEDYKKYILGKAHNKTIPIR
ncbi:MAG: peptide deformylase [Clostridia bacterium]|jgi:peptide deformylase|nr:peptide deformylase [Clostridia bacterium]